MGLWVSKNEGDREWRRPRRYLATTNFVCMSEPKKELCQRKEPRVRASPRKLTSSQRIPSHTKLDDLFVLRFQFSHFFVHLFHVHVPSSVRRLEGPSGGKERTEKTYLPSDPAGTNVDPVICQLRSHPASDHDHQLFPISVFFQPRVALGVGRGRGRGRGHLEGFSYDRVLCRT